MSVNFNIIINDALEAHLQNIMAQYYQKYDVVITRAQLTQAYIDYMANRKQKSQIIDIVRLYMHPKNAPWVPNAAKKIKPQKLNQTNNN